MTVFRFRNKNTSGSKGIHKTISNRILTGVVSEFKPKDIYIFYVKNWFDSKWLNYSGNKLGRIPIWSGVRQENNLELTLPPFHPNRITGQGLFVRQDGISEDSSLYKIQNNTKRLHPSQSSSDNLNRKIKLLSEDAVFIWFGNKDGSEYCSTMIYLIKNGELMSFYVSMKNFIDSIDSVDEYWGFDKAVGISQEQAYHYWKLGKTYELNWDYE